MDVKHVFMMINELLIDILNSIYQSLLYDYLPFML
jgi:hypothetical protein